MLFVPERRRSRRVARRDPRRASESERGNQNGQTRELGNAHLQWPKSGPEKAESMLAGRTTPALAGSGVGCGLAGRVRPVLHSRDAASWPSPHMSNSHSSLGPPPFPCPTKVCALTGPVNGVCRMWSRA